MNAFGRPKKRPPSSCEPPSKGVSAAGQPSAPSIASEPSRMTPAVAIAPSVPHRRAAGTSASVAIAVVAITNGITVA